MLIKVSTLKGFKLNCKDGEIGKTKNFYFDDNYWVIRYLVADTGNWLFGNQVLISPQSLKSADKSAEYINVDLTKKQIEDSPSIENEKPVSRKYEERYNRYYGYPMYWAGPYMWGGVPHIGYTGPILPKYKRRPIDKNSHLRSANDVNGYSIKAKGEKIGSVADYIVDDKTWEIQYLIVDTSGILPGKKVLLSPKWAQNVSWEGAEIYVDLDKDTIEKAPEYTDDTVITDEYMERLQAYYNIES